VVSVGGLRSPLEKFFGKKSQNIPPPRFLAEAYGLKLSFLNYFQNLFY
jgi:hypothetical protein